MGISRSGRRSMPAGPRGKCRRGDVVCLLMRNCPEYMAVWLGITQVGGVVAYQTSSPAMR